MRALLSLALCALALGSGLGTAFVQVENCARASELAALVRETEMLECAVDQLEARCAAYVHPLLQNAAERAQSAPAEPAERSEVQG